MPYRDSDSESSEFVTVLVLPGTSVCLSSFLHLPLVTGVGHLVNPPHAHSHDKSYKWPRSDIKARYNMNNHHPDAELLVQHFPTDDVHSACLCRVLDEWPTSRTKFSSGAQKELFDRKPMPSTLEWETFMNWGQEYRSVNEI